MRRLTVEKYHARGRYLSLGLTYTIFRTGVVSLDTKCFGVFMMMI